MAASKQDISRWYDEGVLKKATNMIVVCDTYDWEDYPVFVFAKEELSGLIASHSGNMQRVMEVYDFSIGKEQQMNEGRAYHV